MAYIFHITSKNVWEAIGNTYRGDTLETEGFIHCSYPYQVLRSAEKFFKGWDGLLLLQIDPALVMPEIRYENLEGGASLYPHIYGPLNVNAVVSAEPLTRDADGAFMAPSILSESL